MVFSDPDFKVTVFLKSTISKTLQDRAIVTIEHYIHMVYRMVSFPITSNYPGYMVTVLYNGKY